ncbi:MAG: ThuA domain-containing protein [Acidobacteriota bacterium]
MRLLAPALALSLLLMLSANPIAGGGPDFSVLVFSKTSGFRHGSIGAGTALIQELGMANGFSVDTTENADDFTTENLARYRVVIWLNTTGDVLDASQQDAFENFIQEGGGFVGVHSATDTEYDWEWYGQLVGGDAWFQNHPAIQDATLDVVDAKHPSTAHLAPSFTFRDEWYNFQNDPTPFVDVLLTIDETTYSGGSMGPGHPISWNQMFDGGRSWYTAMGHGSGTYSDPDFQQHLLGGILWAAGATGPGRIPTTMTLGRAPSGMLQVSWEPSACIGSRDHAIFEGAVGDWSSHRSLACSDTGDDMQELVMPTFGDRYYLVVPVNDEVEGSYGLDSFGNERPASADGACRATRSLSCP